MIDIKIGKVLFDTIDAVEVKTEQIKFVLVYGVGPRILHFGKADGENLLFYRKEDPDNNNEWKLYGGHRVWMTRPYADESTDTYIPDNDPCEIIIDGTKITATSPISPINKLRRGMEIEVLSQTEIKVTNFLINEGNLIYSGSVWSPTCVVPDGKRIVVPLGDENATWDVVKMAIPLKFAGNTAQMQDEQITFEGNNMVLCANGKCTKRVVSAKKGIVKLECDGYDFVKYSQYDKHKRYPFDGCNIAVFNGENNWMAEMETFGHEGEILPGEKVVNEEIWSIKNK